MMITCEGCTTLNFGDSQYCDECGTPLPNYAPAREMSFTLEQTNGTLKEGKEGTVSDVSKAAEDAFGKNSNQAEITRHGAGGAITSHSCAVPGNHAKLVIERGRSLGKEFPLTANEAEIGRWDADGGSFPDVDLDEDDVEAKVSRRHARITRRSDGNGGGGYCIEDLGSTNGTYINRGRRLQPGDCHVLRDGDEIVVGKMFLRFYVLQ